MSSTIRGRITNALVGAGILLLAVIGFGVHSRMSALLTEQFDDDLRSRAAALLSLLHLSKDGEVEFDFKGEFMPEFEHRNGGYFFEGWLYNDTRLLERSNSLGSESLPRFGPVDGVRDFTLSSGRPARAIIIHASSIAGGAYDGEDGDEKASPQKTTPTVTLIVAGETTKMQARLRKEAIGLAAICGLGIILIAIVIRGSLARGLTPLVELSGFANQLNAQNLSPRFPTAGMPAELVPICACINDLLGRLDNAFSRERRFSSDVAHELRTPIAELITLADVGATIPHTSSEAVSFFQDARDIAGKMNATVSALLLIARCESRGQAIEGLPVDISNLVFAVCAQFEGSALARNVVLNCDAPEGVIHNTDAALFSRLIHILLENAVEYTHSHGAICIHVTDNGVRIGNGPTNLISADGPKLCERFWRKDEARSDSSHAGLGLALALEIALLLGLSLTPFVSSNTMLEIRLAWR